MIPLHGDGIRATSIRPLSQYEDALRQGEKVDISFELTTLNLNSESSGLREGEPTLTLSVQDQAEGIAHQRVRSVDSKLNPDGESLIESVRSEMQKRELSATGQDPTVRIYDTLVEGVNSSSLLDPTILPKLASAINENNLPNIDSNIPSIYTYFGQFIAHDITHMDWRGGLAGLNNLASAHFELKSIFQHGTSDCPPFEEDSPGGVALGKTRTFNGESTYNDLLRNNSNAPYGVPCNVDPRNDNNLSISQLTVAVLQFNQLIGTLHEKHQALEIQDITRQHLASIVLDDFLPRIISPEVYNDVRRGHGNDQRRIVASNGDSSFFQISREFAGAFFRFGHAMVRDDYLWNSKRGEVSAKALRESSFILQPSHPHQTRQDWVVEWSKFSENCARSIGSDIASDLQKLPTGWFDSSIVAETDQPLSLALVTLVRGNSLKLPTAQILAETFDLPLIGADEILPDTFDPKGRLSKSERHAICEQTPLWFYMLQEASAARRRASSMGREPPLLGPIASRIVMETVHAAVMPVAGEAVYNGDFEPDPSLLILPKDGDQFTLRHLLENVTRFRN